MNRRTIPNKLLIVPVKEESDIINVSTKHKDAVTGKVYLSGRAPENDPQVEDGQTIQYRRGGTNCLIDDVEMILIDYGQILYIY